MGLITIRNTYSSYSKEVKKEAYIEICNAFMAFLAEKLLTKGEIVLPERVGKLRIVGNKVRVKFQDNKIKGLSVDWKSTNELWLEDSKAKDEKKLIYFFNEETNNISYRVKWIRNKIALKNKTLYNFVFTRANKRDLAKRIKEGKEYLIS